VNTRAISTSIAQSACDVCGRTLLRGEHAAVYLNGGARHSVCELCTSRAVQGGWIREGTIPDYGETTARVDRRRSLLSRLRSRREQFGSNGDDEASAGPEEDPRLGQPLPAPPPPVRAEPPPPRARPRSSGRGSGAAREGRASGAARPGRGSGGVREPRHVRAVPTSVEHKISSAVGFFNSSEHPRTVAGIARSLGLPEVTVAPAAERPSAVNIVLAWELCWYRYEVDLSDEVPSVRVAGQGYELDELSPEERHCNAVADDRGTLDLSAQ
jgi:hypothetical protein